jgi:hypothetical protein
MKAEPIIPIFLLLLVIVMSGCFPGDGQQRTIVGDYRLHQWEDGQTYYLHKRGQDDSPQGGSIIGGTVLRIGWNNHYIVAERHSIYRGDADGWMIIDVPLDAISGPFSDANFRARPEARGIQIFDASEAWKRL